MIKSKLDDISGITNSPLFNETSDPEVFRHHATIGSLRAIWRPRLKGTLSNSSTVSSNNSDQQQNELIHMIKGVSRSSGAALSRVAGSIPWITTDNKRQQYQSPTSLSPNSSSLDIESPSHISTVDETSRVSSAIPSRKLSPLSIQTSVSSADDSDSEISTVPGISPGHLDQDIPSYVQTAPSPATPLIPTTTPPRLRISKSSDTNNLHFMHKEQGDFVPFINIKKASRHTRSVSDSILFDPSFTEKSNTMVDSLRVAFKNYQPLSHKRSLTTSSIYQGTERPTATMNVQTYMTYEKLIQQQRVLQQTYEEMKHMADLYENTAMTLKETYEQRSKEFQMIQNESRGVLEEQNVTERRLKDVEDNSAKLHYELKVLNDKLKDIEDNVGTFYGKVSLLERKMDDSQHSITTMLIIGNYLNHYWIKVREWIRWLNTEDTSDNQK